MISFRFVCLIACIWLERSLKTIWLLQKITCTNKIISDINFVDIHFDILLARLPFQSSVGVAIWLYGAHQWVWKIATSNIDWLHDIQAPAVISWSIPLCRYLYPSLLPGRPDSHGESVECCSEMQSHNWRKTVCVRHPIKKLLTMNANLLGKKLYPNNCLFYGFDLFSIEPRVASFVI